MPDADVIVAGAGLAGASAAFVLSADRNVLVLEAERPAAGASGAAAGLVNPLMGRKAKAVWRIGAALDAFEALLAEADADERFSIGGVLRPAVEAKQVAAFREAAARHPQYAEWLSTGAVHDRFPDVVTAGGALLIPRGGAVDVEALIEALLAEAKRRGAIVRTGARLTGWAETADAVEVKVAERRTTERIATRHLLLAVGQGYPAFPVLRALGLRGVKGQTLRVQRPVHLGPLLPMSGRGYVVPDGDTLVLGSSYEHDFDDLAPSEDATQYIRQKTAQMLPGVDAAEVLDVRVGMRVYAPDTNLPIVGPLPGRARCWLFTGLGSKGLLTAPLIARALPRYLADPASIPDPLRVPMS